MASRESTLFPWAVPSESFCYWFAGIVDGEGSFNIVHSKTGPHCPFHIGLRADDVGVLRYVKTSLGFGSVFYEKRRLGGSRNNNQAARFVVASGRDCMRLVQLFETYPLRSKKQRDFVIWAKAVRLYAGTVTRGNRWGASAEKTQRDSALLEMKRELQSMRKYREVA